MPSRQLRLLFRRELVESERLAGLDADLGEPGPQRLLHVRRSGRRAKLKQKFR